MRRFTIMENGLRFLSAAELAIVLALPGCGEQTVPPASKSETSSSGPVTAKTPAAEPTAGKDQVAAEQPGNSSPEKVDAPHLPNAYRLHPKVISGGLPDGEEAFRELKALGVQTIISVDGAKPQLELAKQYGMKYVHLPHGYDGVPAERAWELAVAVRQLPGPVYIHCHHGKHRSPAAAAVACVETGLIRPEDALAVLKTAGTSENYRGLYQSATAARRVDDRSLDAARLEFPEEAKLTEMAEAMVALEHTHDHVKAIAAAGWKPTAAHPDIDPAHEALLLREHFTELLRMKDAADCPQEFRDFLRESELAAEKLEAVLRAVGEVEKASQALEAVNKNCAACHRAFRDVPLGEK